MLVTNFSLKHNVAVLVLCAGIVLVGSICYRALPRESFPDVEFPFIIVNTVLTGANPTDVEESVTITLETELDGLEGMKEMRSVSADGFSMISIEFHPDVEIQTALNRVRDAVDQGKGDLPPEAEEPIVKEFSFSSVPVVIYHLVGSEAISISELQELAEKLEDKLRMIPGVLDVDIFGGRERAVIIEVDPERLHFYKLTLAQVQAVLRGSNKNVSAGTVDAGAARLVMRVPGEFRSVGDILGLVIGYSTTGVPVYLRDVAVARYGFEDEVSRARMYAFAGDMGAPEAEYVAPRKSVSLHIKKRTGQNILGLVERVDALMASQPMPAGLQAVKGLDMSKHVKMMVADLENGIGTALVLVLLVIFFGMGGRNAVLVSTAVPLSMLLAVTVLMIMGQTLNMIVLFSLILAVGMLVDNAIVIVENIYRHHSLGKTRVHAAMVGTAEVAWPVITSTATTVAAFVPLLFWPGIVGQFMSYLPLTVIVVLLSSLFVALVINPTLAAMFMKLKPGAETTIDPETNRPTYRAALIYQRALGLLLSMPGCTLATTVALFFFIFALYAGFGAGSEFFPAMDPDVVTCSIKPPEGVSLQKSDELAAEMEARIFGAPGSPYDRPVQNLKNANVVVGLEDGMGGGFGAENAGPVRIQVEFVDREYRTESSKATISEMRRRVEGLAPDGRRVAPPLYGAEFDVMQQEEGPPTGQPIAIDILGQDLNAMTRVVRDMRALVRDTEGTVKPTDDAVTGQPTVEWLVDRGRAGMFALEQGTVSSILQMGVGGLRTGTFGHGDDEQDILLRLPEEYRADTVRLGGVSIPTPLGGAVPVLSTASAELVPGPVAIKHFNGVRVLNVSAQVQPGIMDTSGVRESFREKVEAYPFPPGVSYRMRGAADEEAKAREFLGRAFIIVLLAIIMIMVLQFNSLGMSAIIMSSVVLSVMGVLIGLLVLHAPFGIIMTGIAVISLAGVVVNNAIVLLDAIRQFERRGQELREAIVSACMIRFRPVMLTATTTVLGLLPMALKLNWDFLNFTFQYDTSSAQWWQSMATAVIFGLFFSTMLTLGVVPCAYLLYGRLRQRFGWADLVPHDDPPPAANLKPLDQAKEALP